MPGKHTGPLQVEHLYRAWKDDRGDSGEEELSVGQVHYFRNYLRALDVDVPDRVSRRPVREWLEEEGNRAEIASAVKDAHRSDVVKLRPLTRGGSPEDKYGVRGGR